MAKKMTKKHKREVIRGLVYIFLFILLSVAYFMVRSTDSASEYGECTKESKLCSDGTMVGRSGPMCEFVKCANEYGILWATTTATVGGTEFTYKYPSRIGAQYMSETLWPPQLEIEEKSFECQVEDTSSMGKTKRKILNGHLYCVTKVDEEMAGSTYTNYTYSFPFTLPDTSYVMTMTFGIRAMQCGNYGDDDKNKCISERTAYDIDELVDQMVSTIMVN